MDTPAPIVFYDSDCGLCNRSVQFILSRNTKEPLLYFASLQSDFATHFFSAHKQLTPDGSSLIFFENGVFYSKSDGALRIARYLSGYQLIGRIGLLFPQIIRDFVYSRVAKNRHQFGKTQCKLRSTEETKRFLDKTENQIT